MLSTAEGLKSCGDISEQSKVNKIKNNTSCDLRGVLISRFDDAPECQRFLRQARKMGVRLILDGTHKAIYIHPDDYENLSEFNKTNLKNIADESCDKERIHYILSYSLVGSNYSKIE